MSCYKNENLIEEAIHVLAMEGFEAASAPSFL